MPKGTVKWFSVQRGYGFIVPDDGGADTFVHISTVERAGLGLLNEGQRLEYDVNRDKGRRVSAVNLRSAE
ncbi:MAG: cold-shock protein [Geminicoccaceae bacterium]